MPRSTVSRTAWFQNLQMYERFVWLWCILRFTQFVPILSAYKTVISARDISPIFVIQSSLILPSKRLFSCHRNPLLSLHTNLIFLLHCLGLYYFCHTNLPHSTCGWLRFWRLTLIYTHHDSTHKGVKW